MRHTVVQLSVSILLVSLFISCAVYYGGNRYRIDTGSTYQAPMDVNGSPAPLVFGRGKGTTASASERDALYDILRRTGYFLVGEDAKFYGREIDEVITNIRYVEPYIAAGTLQIVTQKTDGSLVYTAAGARVNLQGLAKLLEHAGVLGGSIGTQQRLLLPDEDPESFRSEE